MDPRRSLSQDAEMTRLNAETGSRRRWTWTAAAPFPWWRRLTLRGTG